MAANEINLSEVQSLVSDLIRSTKVRSLGWEQADEQGQAFYLASAGGIVRIESLRGGDHPYVLHIFDADEREIFEQRTEVATFYSPAEGALAELFAVVRGSIYDVSGTITRIRRSLEL